VTTATEAKPEDFPALTLALTPKPGRCGKVVKNPDAFGGETCVRDEGHSGKHRNWRHPACGTCGFEMQHHSKSVSYSCSHPRIANRDGVRRVPELHSIAYKLSRIVAGGIPTGEQIDDCERLVAYMENEGWLA
jgi:hypothetical protein